jgi:putative ABC transport system permease protein
MDLPAAQRLLGKTGRVDQIDVILRPDADVSHVAERLRGRLPAVLTVERPAQRGAEYERVFASFRAMLTGISTLCLIAGVYIIYNTTATGAVKRACVASTVHGWLAVAALHAADAGGGRVGIVGTIGLSADREGWLRAAWSRRRWA